MLSYSDLERVLAQAGSDVQAASCHGFLCGQICAAGVADEYLWQEFLRLRATDELAIGDSRDEIRTLIGAIQEQLSSLELEFDLMLPDEECDLESRVDALAQWCRGFVLGNELSRPGLESQPREHGDEILDDVRMISRAGIDEQMGEEDEKMLVELVEYVRVGAILMFEELHFSREKELPEILH